MKERAALSMNWLESDGERVCENALEREREAEKEGEIDRREEENT